MIDVFSGSGVIAWDLVKAAGHSVGFAKCSQGSSEIDEACARNVAGMRAVGMTPGVYHFATFSNGAAECAHAVNAAHAAGWQSHTDARLALDLEPDPANVGVEDRVGRAGVRKFVEDFTSQYQLLTGKLPMIYGSKDFLDQYVGPGFGGHPLWLARYLSDADGNEIRGLTSLPIGTPAPALPEGWVSWQCWQFTQWGTCPGISPGNADLSDVFDGTAGVAALIG